MVNGDTEHVETEEAPGVPHERTETGGDDPEEGEVDDYFYDKTKSFFDNISSEASDRAKG